METEWVETPGLSPQTIFRVRFTEVPCLQCVQRSASWLPWPFKQKLWFTIISESAEKVFLGFPITCHGLLLGEQEKYEENKQKQAFSVRGLSACQINRLDAEAISLVFAALSWLLHREVGQLIYCWMGPWEIILGRDSLCEPLCVDWKSLVARVSQTKVWLPPSNIKKNNWKRQKFLKFGSPVLETWFLLTQGDLCLWSAELGKYGNRGLCFKILWLLSRILWTTEI